MTQKSIKILKITLVFLLSIYITSYIFLSRVGMYRNTLGADGITVWSFGSLRQQMHVYMDKKSDDYHAEMKIRIFYLPLIKLDRYLFGNYHVLEEDLPDLGG